MFLKFSSRFSQLSNTVRIAKEAENKKAKATLLTILPKSNSNLSSYFSQLAILKVKDTDIQLLPANPAGPLGFKQRGKPPGNRKSGLASNASLSILVLMGHFFEKHQD